MDTLTGSHDFYEDNLKPSNSDRYQVADQKTVTDFLEGRCYYLNPELFVLVSNLDPREVSDHDFLRAAQKFSDQDFVRAAFLAYFKYEPSFYDFNFWTKEIKIRKGDRSYFLDKLRKSEQFFKKWNL